MEWSHCSVGRWSINRRHRHIAAMAQPNDVNERIIRFLHQDAGATDAPI
jgi:hypothetical protein